jgi:hypothetical protein
MVCGDRKGEGLPQKKARDRSSKLVLTRLNESLSGKRYCIHRTVPLRMKTLKMTDRSRVSELGKMP